LSEIRVLLVDDHAMLRAGIRALLSYHDNILVVGEAQDGAVALERVGELLPDVVLMDIAMERMNGLDATRLICTQYPQCRVLILSQHDNRQYVLPLLQAGASGYLLKSAPSSDLIRALQTVAKGEIYLDPSLSSILVEEMRRHDPQRADTIEALTEREQEILTHIVHGLSNPQIAVALSLSVKTVEWHRANLMSKLDMHNVADLVRYALQHGLVKD